MTAALRVMSLSDEGDFAKYHHVLNRAVWSSYRAAGPLLALLMQHLDKRRARARRWQQQVGQRWERLTGREREVLALMAEGKTDREIAQVLQITNKTVGHHVSHILEKLHLCSRTGAALWFEREVAQLSTPKNNWES